MTLKRQERRSGVRRARADGPAPRRASQVKPAPPSCERHLLDFLNAFRTPADFRAVAAHLSPGAAEKLAHGILHVRERLGAFLTITDLASIPGLEMQTIERLLESARGSLFVETSTLAAGMFAARLGTSHLEELRDEKLQRVRLDLERNGRNIRLREQAIATRRREVEEDAGPGADLAFEFRQDGALERLNESLDDLQRAKNRLEIEIKVLGGTDLARIFAIIDRNIEKQLEALEAAARRAEAAGDALEARIQRLEAELLRLERKLAEDDAKRTKETVPSPD